MFSFRIFFFRSFILIIFLFSAGTCVFAKSGEWELKKEKRQIKVYLRDVEDSPIKEFKGVMIVPYSMTDTINFFENDDVFCSWMNRCEDAKLLDQKGPNEKILYLHLEFPWPVKDRDCVTHRIKQPNTDTGEVLYILREKSDYYPKQKGLVRMPYLKGEWRFTPIGEQAVEITFRQHVDAGGIIPDWISNKLVVDVPYSTLKNFRKALIEDSKKRES